MFLIPQVLFADGSATVTISAMVGVSAPVSPDEGGGSGSGVGGVLVTIPDSPTVINFSGFAYLFSSVYILIDGQAIMATTPDKTAHFSASISGLQAGTYNFSIYGEDDNGKKSSVLSFPIIVTKSNIINISNIFLSRTLDLDNNEIKTDTNLVDILPKNDSLKTKPPLEGKTTEDQALDPLLNRDTTIPNNGVNYYVSRVDFNSDNHIDLKDFSVLVSWYTKPKPPRGIDLNDDGKITLADFSIMASHWTD
ncbi:TPA: hypothetical protein DCS03_03985 [Candidatus Nomurabacteria bacterium]|nr:hypothetical protein [Candidatus Nomurabacteria bacterium]HAS70137.1 hypothetical protein [Candidatus Nomurabacteria bacterium]HBI34552.1 hypothetical protein [Candidatus Nomurabacteria bacterium]